MYLIIHLNTILLPLCADVHFVGAERDLGSSTQLQPTPCLLRYTTANPSLDWACTLCNKIKRLRIFHQKIENLSSVSILQRYHGRFRVLGLFSTSSDGHSGHVELSSYNPLPCYCMRMLSHSRPFLLAS